jgi:hypothetical protein
MIQPGDWKWDIPGFSKRLRRALGYFGLQNEWGMFTPEAPRSDFFLEAEIVSKKGKMTKWEGHRMDALPKFRAFRQFQRHFFLINTLFSVASFDSDPKETDEVDLSKLDGLMGYLRKAYGSPKDPVAKVSLFVIVKRIPLKPGVKALAAYRKGPFTRSLLHRVDYKC